MKYLLVGSLCLSFLALSGCQTQNYPKKPSQVSGWGGYDPVNRFVPQELKPYEVPPKVEYVGVDKEVPKRIVVIK